MIVCWCCLMMFPKQKVMFEIVRFFQEDHTWLPFQFHIRSYHDTHGRTPFHPNVHSNYLQATKNLSEKTLSAYRSDLKLFFEFEPNELKPDICAYVSHLHINLKLKDTSIRRKIITLKNYYIISIIKNGFYLW